MGSSAKVLVLLSSVLLLAGCAAASIPEFEVEQTYRDVVVVADPAARPSIDPDSTRYVGDVEGAELYLSRGEHETTCLILIRDEVWELTGCGAGGGLGWTLESGTLLEVGDFRFSALDVAGGTRTKLSDSVTVISFP
jgi:hypothetical protein